MQHERLNKLKFQLSIRRNRNYWLLQNDMVATFAYSKASLDRDHGNRLLLDSRGRDGRSRILFYIKPLTMIVGVLEYIETFSMMQGSHLHN